MKPVNRDVNLDDLLGGATEIIGRDVLEKKIRGGKRLVVKHGVDPTARDIHLGYAVNYQAMRRFQDAGHTVVLLIGDFTSSIGDPTGKDKTRPQLTSEQIEANIESMLQQVDRVLDIETLVIRRNSEWFKDMRLAEWLSLGTRISAARLWERDMFQRRLKNSLPVYLHEFSYPVLQGYDSYMLESDITINGSDQKFNELMGREIQQLFGQSPQSIMIMPMLQGTDGVDKMSQSLGNYIGLAEAPEQQYGKVLSIPDSLMENYYRLCTRLPGAEIDALLASADPMATKMRLARTIVAQYHSPEAAEAAEARFIQVHRKKAVPDEMPEITLETGGEPLWICQALVDCGLVKSTSQARRDVMGGGVRVDGESLTDFKHNITEAGTYLIQKGKRHFVRLTVR